ncbi:unnamed protein product, partial [Staurois parvus]
AQQCHLSVLPSSATCQCCPAVPPVSAQQCRPSLVLSVSAAYQCPSLPPHQCYLSVTPHQCPSVLPISAASPTHIKEEILPVCKIL